MKRLLLTTILIFSIISAIYGICRFGLASECKYYFN